MDARTVSLVGSTGSIGTQAIDVIQGEPERFRVVALGASRSVALLAAQAAELRPEVVAIAEAGLARELEGVVDASIEVRAGPDAMESIADGADVVLNAVVGFAGLPVTLAALGGGRRLALANKESLVAGGPVVSAARETPGAELIPVDSEHSAIHQCLQGGASGALDRIVLTASGGPFRGRRRDDLRDVTVVDALAHPTWSMGPKISVDSSTMMNKGLEVIEAHELFGAEYGIDYDRVDVVVHPQSVVHSMVTFSDGATVAQLSMPDMRLPIGYALGYPDRHRIPYGAVDWAKVGSLDFEEPDLETFSCLRLAYAAGRTGGTAPAWLNAANEVAVDAFLAGRIGWLDIADVIEETMQDHDGGTAHTVDDVLDADRRARERSRRVRDRRAATR